MSEPAQVRWFTDRPSPKRGKNRQNGCPWALGTLALQRSHCSTSTAHLPQATLRTCFEEPTGEGAAKGEGAASQGAFVSKTCHGAVETPSCRALCERSRMARQTWICTNRVSHALEKGSWALLCLLMGRSVIQCGGPIPLNSFTLQECLERL